MQKILDIEYSPNLLLDIYNPGHPIVLWVHGGGWRFGDRKLAPDLEALAEEYQLTFASLDYRLTDEVQFPAQLTDIDEAIAYLAENYDAPIGVWGASAGGHLALFTGLNNPQVQAVHADYPPTDIADIARRTQVARPDADLATIFEGLLIGANPLVARDAAQAASPVYSVKPVQTVFQLAHGTGDVLVDFSQSVRFHEALLGAGVTSNLYLLPGFKHGYVNQPGALDVQKAALFDDGRLAAEQPVLCDDGREYSFATICQFFVDNLH